MSEKNYHSLLSKLDKFIRKYYKNQLIKGLLYGTSSVLAFFLAVSFAEYFGHFNATVRTVLFFSFIASSIAIVGRWVFFPLLQLYRIGPQITYAQAANLIGNHFPEVNDKLVNTLQLKAQQEASSSEFSLLEASIDQRISELNPVPFSSAIDLSKNRKYLKYAIPPLLFLLIVIIGAPSIITDGTGRLVQYNEEFALEAPFQFIIQNSSLKAGELEDFDLLVKMTGDEVPGRVFIETDGNQFKLQKESLSEFQYTFRKIRKNVRFRLFADGFYSKEYELEALPIPLLLHFDVEVDYPAYTGKKDETLANTGDLVVPAGTEINWSFKTKNAKQVELSFSDSAVFSNQLGENLFSHSKRFLKSQAYAISTNNDLMSSRDSVRYSVSVVPDQYPTIKVSEKQDTVSSKKLYFRGEVADDYGFTGLYFHYRFLESDDPEKLASKPDPVELTVNPSVNNDQFYHFWDFENLNIKAGDQIEYYFEVWDNDGVSGSKSTRSKQSVFKAPTLEELEARAEENSEKIKEELENSIDEARELQEDLEKLNRKMLEQKQFSWQEKQQIRDMLEKQKNLENKIENIKQENQKSLQEQSEYKEMNERIMEKQQQLEELFEQVMTDEMKELFEKLEELMEEANKEKVQEMLEDMQLSNEDIEKELDRSLEIYKQLEFEQKLEETIEKIDELKEKQEDLAEKTDDKGEDTEELKKEQEELNEEFEELQEDLDDLQKKNEELENKQDLPDTDEKEEATKEDMEKSSEELGDQKRKKAKQSQDDAAKKMQEMSDQMKNLQQSMSQESSMEDMNALRQLLDNLVELSFDQEDLMAELKGTAMNDPRYHGITQDQKKLKDDASVIEDSLFALSKRNPNIQPIVNREIAAINANMNKTIKMLSEQPPGQARNYTNRAISHQQYTMTSVNNLALLLDEAIQAMQQAMSQQKFGEGSCNKPGSSGGAKPSMQNMKQMQQQISKQIQQLQKQMEQQGQQMPGGKKEGQKGQGGQGGQGQGGMSKELARLAAEQEALRNELRKMAEQLGEGGENGEGGAGGLDGLQKLMEENERDLVNKNITRETVKRQQEIMSKLLESERAEREREYENKRESKEGQDQNSVDPAELFDNNLVNGKEIELLKTVPPNLEPFYKKKVNDYFNGFDE